MAEQNNQLLQKDNHTNEKEYFSKILYFGRMFREKMYLIISLSINNKYINLGRKFGCCNVENSPGFVHNFNSICFKNKILFHVNYKRNTSETHFD